MYRRHVLARTRLYRRYFKRFIMHNVLHADDPPHKLALGAAIGMFISFTPTIGFQMATVVLVSWIVRANKVIGLPVTWVSNPITMVPMFYWCHRLGAAMTGYERVGREWWRQLAYPPEGWWAGIAFYWGRLMEIAVPLWVGSLVLGLLAGLVTYLVVNRLVRFYRLRRWGAMVPPTALQFRPRELEVKARHAGHPRPVLRPRKHEAADGGIE